MKKKKVAVIMGSESDLSAMEDCFKTLKELGIGFEVRVMSAHRTPKEVTAYIEKAASNGFRVIIAAAGGAAHLAGVIAGHTTLPVIGVPMKSSFMDGLDSLLSMVQMPSGVPVAVVGLGKAGPVNAAILSAQILAVADDAINHALKRLKDKMADGVRASDRKVKKRF